MSASRLSRFISRLRNVLEGSIKAWIEGLDVSFHISNASVYTFDLKLSYVILKLQTNLVSPIKEKCLWRVISWLQNVLEQCIKAQIKGLEIHFHVSWKKYYFFFGVAKESFKNKKKINFTN